MNLNKLKILKFIKNKNLTNTFNLKPLKSNLKYSSFPSICQLCAQSAEILKENVSMKLWIQSTANSILNWKENVSKLNSSYTKNAIKITFGLKSLEKVSKNIPQYIWYQEARESSPDRLLF